MKQIKVTIVQQGANNTRDQFTTFNEACHFAESIEECLDLIYEKYFIKPPKRLRSNNSVYVTKNEVNIVTGFLVSRWNHDVSHMTPKWFERNWIWFDEVEINPIEFSLPKNKQ